MAIQNRYRMPSNQAETALSVMMIAHNAEKTISLAVRSALLAMPRHSELLVYLDGCTDSTNQRLNNIHDRRLKIEAGDSQKGIAFARNRLLEIARGKFLAVLDSDDICLPWRFAHQLHVMRTRQPDLLFSSALVLVENRRKSWKLIPQVPLSMNNQQARLFLTICNPFVHSSLIAMASSIRLLEGYRNRAAEDYDLYLRAAHAKMYISKTACFDVIYRKHASQVTKQKEWNAELSDELHLDANLTNLRLEIATSLGAKSVEDHQIITLLKSSSWMSRVYFGNLSWIRGLMNSYLSK